ncbi:MAG: radical SAM protein [Candidatus Diapherotrites archaeon]|nr:radical SAM protein [Candidatus Diapherotrites archaeon]
MVERLDLKLGFKCNNNCLSCPAAHRRRLGDMSTEQAKEQILAGRKDGAIEVVLTGGEPTVRPDLVELVWFARENGYERVQLQTNARMLSYKSLAVKLVEAGVNDFCVGLHSDTAEIQEFLTQCPGSFQQTIQGIKNLVALGQHVAINSVVHKLDFERLPKRAEMAVDLGVQQFQLAFIHCAGNAMKNIDLLLPRKSEVKPFVHKALDIVIEAGLTTMVEAYPYCFMQGYEKYCSELYMPPSEIRDAEGVVEDFDVVRKESGKLKGPECPKCRFFAVCEGPWKEYPEKFGWSEFVPMKGKKVLRQEDLL